jgi:N4-(beta-N-acetylglucosaminyl)-L-asparaginase
MQKRRFFIKSGLLAALGGAVWSQNACNLKQNSPNFSPSKTIKPIAIATWSPNAAATLKAYETMASGGYALDAVEQGIHIPEADPLDTSVGYGGFPDETGEVALDACIMNESGNFGSVMAIKGILHPISVAKRMLDHSTHVYLVGDGALEFAKEQGYQTQELLTEVAKEAWEKWKAKGSYDPMLTPKQILERIQSNHDTIGLIAIDQEGRMCGGCSTSGLAFKKKGRIGDSPIIGAGLFVDNEVGGASCSGLGEEVAKVCGAHVVVECMRNGLSPEEACREAISRIVKNADNDAREIQVGFIAMHKSGAYGAYAINKNFSYAVTDSSGTRIYDAPSWYD